MTTSATSSVSSSTISLPETSMMESRRSSSTSSLQPSSCTTMPGLTPSRAAMPALSTLIPAAPPCVLLLLLIRCELDAALSGERPRGDASRENRADDGDTGTVRTRADGRHDLCEDHPQPGHVTPLASADRKSTRLNSSHANISYAVFCLKKKKLTT